MLVEFEKWSIWVYCCPILKKENKRYLSSLFWKKWLKFEAQEGEFLFKKLVKIVAFYCRPLPTALNFKFQWRVWKNFCRGLLKVLCKADFHSASCQEKNLTSMFNIYRKVRGCWHEKRKISVFKKRVRKCKNALISSRKWVMRES